jgi:hypothetical protein
VGSLKEKKKPKSRVTIYLDTEQWQAFRMACLKEKVSASGKIGALIAHHTEEKRDGKP